MWGWKKKNTFIFRCDFNGVITDEPTVMTAGQEARRVALNVRNWQKHQNVQLPLGLFVTESLLCCHHGIDWPSTLCHHMKSWNCPLGDPPAITCWINFPLSRTFVRNAHSRQRGTEDRGRVGRKRIAAGASPQPPIVTCILIFILFSTQGS